MCAVVHYSKHCAYGTHKLTRGSGVILKFLKQTPLLRVGELCLGGQYEKSFKKTERLIPIASSLATLFNEGEITNYILFTQGKDGETHRFGAGCKYATIGALRIIEHDVLLEHSKNS